MAYRWKKPSNSRRVFRLPNARILSLSESERAQFVIFRFKFRQTVFDIPQSVACNFVSFRVRKIPFAQNCKIKFMAFAQNFFFAPIFSYQKNRFSMFPTRKLFSAKLFSLVKIFQSFGNSNLI